MAAINMGLKWFVRVCFIVLGTELQGLSTRLDAGTIQSNPIRSKGSSSRMESQSEQMSTSWCTIQRHPISGAVLLTHIAWTWEKSSQVQIKSITDKIGEGNRGKMPLVWFRGRSIRFAPTAVSRPLTMDGGCSIHHTLTSGESSRRNV